MADTTQTVTRDDSGADTTERVGLFTLTVASSEPSPDAEQRWARRAEVLTGWLVAAWRREHAQGGELIIDGQQRSDEDGAICGCDLN